MHKSNFLRFEDYEEKLYEFERITNDSCGIDIPGQADYFSIANHILELLSAYNKEVRHDSTVDVRQAWRKAIGLVDIINNVIDGENNEEFDSLCNHIELLFGETGIVQNEWSTVSDQNSNKIFELYIAFILLRFCNNIDLDNPVGFAFIIILLAYLPEYDIKPLIVSLSSIVILTFLLIFTLKESERLNKQRVFFYSILPIGVITILVVFSYSLRNNQYVDSIKVIPSNKIELFDLDFNITDAQLGKRAIFSGGVKNNSNSKVNRVIVGIKIHNVNRPEITFSLEEALRAKPENKIYIDSLPDTVKKYVNRVIDSETFYWDSYVDPGQVKSFEMISYPSFFASYR